MKIAADKNILFVRESFSTLGGTVLFDIKDIVNENIKDFDVLLIRSTTKVDKKLLENTKIKFVGSAVAGIDHVDIDYLQKKRIGFSSASGCNARSVAEYVLTVIYVFCMQKNISPKNFVVGIIGVGHIGGQVSEILKKLGIKTILNDPILEKQSVSNKFSSIEYLAKNSDIITVHTPLTKSGEYKTENLLDENFFTKVKKNIFLIQASRGAVCNENALMKSMSKIQKPVIDVWADEPDVNVDLARNCLFATQHIAGHSFDGKINGTKIIYDACCDFFSRKQKFDFEKEVFSKIPNQSIEYAGSVGNVLLKCCPIDADSLDFEKLLALKNADERKIIFKELRENYRKRLEFSHYTVSGVPLNESESLRNLGFYIK
ncbi:MAG: 4-phosphoerythronate dehydrogenase [Chitinispirillales bacterium]|nr:4-phosphoerythronate dehydrogenase [Chitinispirillales bacterium]